MVDADDKSATNDAIIVRAPQHQITGMHGHVLRLIHPSRIDTILMLADFDEIVRLDIVVRRRHRHLHNRLDRAALDSRKGAGVGDAAPAVRDLAGPS